MTPRTPETRELEKADRYSRLGNWEASGLIYARLEQRYRTLADKRDELYAHVSRFGSEEEFSNLQVISNELRTIIALPMVQKDLALMQRCLEMKVHIDLNLDGVSARPSLEALERVAKKRGDAEAQSRASGELGIVAFLEGNPAEARRRVVGAIARAFIRGDKGAEIRYLSLMGQGLVENRRATEALWFLNRALSISSDTPDKGFPKLAISGKASALTQLGRFAESHEVITEGLNYARTHGYVGYEVDMLAQAGQLALSQNEIPDAIRFYESAAKLASQIRFNRGLAQVNAQLADLYKRVGNLPRAEKCEAISIKAHLEMGEVYVLPHHLAVQADLQVAIGDPDAAHRTYSVAERIVDTMLNNSPTPGLKKTVVAAMSEIYVGDFRLAVHEKDSARAYNIIEEVRGRVAADRLRATQPDLRSRPEITAAERHLAVLQMQLLDTVDRRERQRIADSLTDFEQQMPVDGGSDGGHLRERPSLRDLQSVLAPNEMVLEYVLGDPESYCLLITSKRQDVFRLADRETINGLAEKDLTAIKSKQLAIEEGRQLFSAVVAPLSDLPAGNDLIVIPDGNLHQIPFATLVDKTNRYLIESHTIAYSPSSSVLTLIRKERAASLKGMLAIGAVPYSKEAIRTKKWQFFRGLDSLERRAFTPLPATGDEVRTVAAALHDLNVETLEGQMATESNFKRETAKRPRVIHLAVHAFTDKTYPDRAGLVFAAGDSDDDGLLQVREIRRLPLGQTSLVTLSACDTSAGTVEGEEGVSSIVYAFLYAGARSAVSSYWMIEDSSTGELMKIFYTELSHGQQEAVALRTAQQELLRRGAETLAPFYWAGFSVIGDGSRTIEEARNHDN
jgi:CHAT domain-containing protein/tetratricopeptide (TPR) repeat protein